MNLMNVAQFISICEQVWLGGDWVRAGVMVVVLAMSAGGATTPCTTFSSLMPGEVEVHLPVHMPG